VQAVQHKTSQESASNYKGRFVIRLKQDHSLDSDEALMQAYTLGRSSAFELYARHEGALFRFVRRLMGGANEAQAEEVFQECWLRVVASRASFSPDKGASWKTWAFTIAHNLAMDRLRRSGREISLEENESGSQAEDQANETGTTLDWLQSQLGENDPGADDIAHWRSAGKRLLHCLDHLPEVQRSAFLMHYEEDLGLEAIAQTLSLGFETVKSRLRYALGKLRTCMQGYISWDGPV
jgi:RNA polymerase sigma factor (sigma-70 family)